jgi:hypothetical protein
MHLKIEHQQNTKYQKLQISQISKRMTLKLAHPRNIPYQVWTAPSLVLPLSWDLWDER